jgi:hypothetical protein
MTTCTQMEIAAIPETNKVLISCASHATGSVAVCDVGTATCGSPYSLSDALSAYPVAHTLSAWLARPASSAPSAISGPTR